MLFGLLTTKGEMGLLHRIVHEINHQHVFGDYTF